IAGPSSLTTDELTRAAAPAARIGAAGTISPPSTPERGSLERREAGGDPGPDLLDLLLVDRQRRRDGDAAGERADQQPFLATRAREPRRRRGIGGERLLAQLDRAEQAEPGTHLRDERMRLQRAQRVLQRTFERAAALDQPVALVELERRERRRTAGRVAGVRR